MSEKDQPKKDHPKENLPQKKEGDYFEKGRQGIIPPKPPKDRPGEGLSDGAPGWTPPKKD